MMEAALYHRMVLGKQVAPLIFEILQVEVIYFPLQESALLKNRRLEE